MRIKHRVLGMLSIQRNDNIWLTYVDFSPRFEAPWVILPGYWWSPWYPSAQKSWDLWSAWGHGLASRRPASSGKAIFLKGFSTKLRLGPPKKRGYCGNLLGIPSGKRYIIMENHHAINGKTHYFLWPFSIAMLNLQRVPWDSQHLIFDFVQQIQQWRVPQILSSWWNMLVLLVTSFVVFP